VLKASAKRCVFKSDLKLSIEVAALITRRKGRGREVEIERKTD